MKSEKIFFENADGEKLSGRIDFPLARPAKAFVLFAHCFTCSKNLKAVDNICDALTQNGMAVLRFDFTGLGQSEGAFADTNFSSNLNDLVKAYEYLNEHHQAPQILMGHSLGGAAVLHVAGQMEAVNAVVTIAAPADPTHVKKLFSEDEEKLKENGEAEVNIGGRPFKMKKQFLDDLEAQDSKEVIHNLDKALLILHSPQDEIVGIDNAAEIYENAMHPKSFITLDGSDHLMSDPENSRYVGSIVGPWASRYLTDQQAPEVAPEGEVWTRIGSEGFFTEISAGKHPLIADEPKNSGGTDLGPSPYDYLLSALGTCTAMTLRMYADHKKLDLKEVRVKLTHKKIHAQDGENSEEKKNKIDRIARKVILEGELTDEQRKRLIEIADKCPVHKTLEGRPKIETQEVKDF
ncbi:bifunctional alpha/beta hydrolase/OsmC family protein [Marinoscillum furvescens]|uniref:Putative redox protein n=1 Tax=Marinoscillum furvescens DSM 4134 TaxID=1122208 RepID=A0A3D9L6G6_MARFU|nr:bifunctional alpha/beta hydrolase/OsmC family protein [Marinoscillum furvescens]REE01770.1 putative redox protein [Marinoscillum furvescens DSM 4134]